MSEGWKTRPSRSRKPSFSCPIPARQRSRSKRKWPKCSKRRFSKCPNFTRSVLNPRPASRKSMSSSTTRSTDPSSPTSGRACARGFATPRPACRPAWASRSSSTISAKPTAFSTPSPPTAIPTARFATFPGCCAANCSSWTGSRALQSMASRKSASSWKCRRRNWRGSACPMTCSCRPSGRKTPLSMAALSRLMTAMSALAFPNPCPGSRRSRMC